MIKRWQVFNESLTSRELEIVHVLNIKEATVRHHFTVIFSQMQVSGRQQLLIAAHQQGFIEFGAGAP